MYRSVIRSLTIRCSILMLFMSLGCGGGSAPDDNIFRYNEPSGIGSLDPAFINYQAAIWAGSQLYNGLVEADENEQIKPCIARSWSGDSTATVWTFNLRTDVFFHEDECFGSARTRRLTATDVKYSFERVCDARIKSAGQWIFRSTVDGAEAYIKATAAGESPVGIRGITAPDDSTLVIRTAKPFAPFLSLLTTPFCWIVPKEATEFYKERFAHHPVGSGPFRFLSWEQDRDIRLKRNERYFRFDDKGVRLPYLDGIKISFIRSPKSEFFEFEQGRLDFVATIDNSVLEQVITPDGNLTPKFADYKQFRKAAQSVEYYGFLLDTAFTAAKNGPYSTSKVLRQALNYAIDRDRIVRYVLRGRAVPAHNGILPPSMPGFSPEVKGYDYNIQKARELLLQAGYGPGKSLPPITLQIGANERTASVAEAVQQQWKEIGLDARIVQVDFPRHLGMIRNSELPLWRTSWIADYPDPENFLALFYSKNASPAGPNTTHFRNATFDSLYEQALSPKLNPAERYTLYNRMERIVIDDAPWIFLYHDVSLRLARPSVIGFRPESAGRLVLETVKKSR